MTASLDQMYEDMLRGEFSSEGQHAAPEPAPVEPDDAAVRAVHVADADAPLHAEFEVPAAPAAVAEPVAEDTAVDDGAVTEREGPRGLARYRNAAMVGAGGLACAAVGAFLGGVGGYFTVAPAAAHPLASSTTPGAPVANAANDGGTSASDTQAVVAAALTSLSGSLTQNAAPLQWLTAQSGT